MVDPLPALTGLCVAEKDGGKVAGVRADGAVTLQIGEEKYCESGELQFTSYGLSGIPVFQISRYAARALNQGIECSVTLDLCPPPETGSGAYKIKGSESIYPGAKRCSRASWHVSG